MSALLNLPLSILGQIVLHLEEKFVIEKVHFLGGDSFEGSKVKFIEPDISLYVFFGRFGAESQGDTSSGIRSDEFAGVDFREPFFAVGHHILKVHGLLHSLWSELVVSVAVDQVFDIAD